jgi:ubiquinone/menaquinone biosynthesis C-methylase UbiE
MDRPPESASEGSARTRFEEGWRERFEEFATSREDDAGIAGWSLSGLETRFRFFRRLWNPAQPGALYVDVGCGAGTYARWLAEQRLRVIGVDYSQPTLTKARARTSESIFLCAGDATRLPFPNASVDGALCFGLLQAVSDSAPVICELARILKPRGELWIDALNGGGLAARIAQARLRLKGKGMHLRYESPKHVRRILSDAGFDTITRHWLPIVPSRIHRMQPFVESAVVRWTFAHLPPIGALFSHSFAFHARRVANPLT